MPNICNTSVLTERIIHAAIELVDERTQELRAIVDSESSTPAEKYEAFITLGYMTGVLRDGHHFSHSA